MKLFWNQTHVYFDHPKGISKSGNKSKKYSLSNVSYLSDTPWSDKAKGYDSSNALRKIGIHVLVLRFITHFYSMNLALFIGMIDYLTVNKKGVWEPTKRKQDEIQ